MRWRRGAGVKPFDDAITLSFESDFGMWLGEPHLEDVPLWHVEASWPDMEFPGCLAEPSWPPGQCG